ncbi:superoxide dismutase [Sandaracinobacteroides saxicola]|uniref:Superoxide dismutase n=2 Tax=Sandaracinobacteroides saxicola TaxID=2759707 RepID=A0A7G5IM86_9SPHN|nr:superoxide dismutase [Sandaracinobacteroides saxicola]
MSTARTAAPLLGSAAPVASGRFTLPPLPYAPSALSPAVSAETLALHHGKHHQAYVDALNKAVAETPAARGKPLEALFASASTLPAAIRNNGGGHWNHSFYWESMAGPDRRGAPSKALSAAIERAFGGMEGLRTAFDEKGKGRFGSGWAWLILQDDGRLAVTSTPNQDNPLFDDADEKGVPLLTNDVWEHAYYLSFQNRRPDYLNAFWNAVNWSVVSERYATSADD